MAIALQFRSRFITPRSQSLLRDFSSSSPPGFNEGADDDDDNKKEPKPSSFSWHFSDVKASLKQTPPPPPLSLDEIRKHMSELRRRSALRHLWDNYSSRSSADKPISSQELYMRNVAAEGEQGKTNALGGNKSVNISLDELREDVRRLKLKQPLGSRGPNDRVSSTKVVNPFSIKSFMETLKMKPDEPGTGFSGPVGGMNQLPNVVFGKEEKMKMDTESTSSTKTDFVKTYDYGELGKKVQKLSSTGSKGGFSLHKLNDRLRNLRELEEDEMESTIHGVSVSFRDQRESLVKLRSSSDDETKMQSNLGGGTPTFMLSPPKEQLVEQMGDSQGNGKRKDYKTWTAKESNALLQLMVEGAMLGFRDINGVISKSTVEAKLLPKLKEKISKEITYSQYQSRVKWFKKQYNNYSQLMRHNSEFGWDPITKRFTAPDEVWADYLKSHPTHAHFQSETFADYEDLKIAVGNGTATGMWSIGLGDDTDATTYDKERNGSWEFCGMDDLVFDQDNNAFVQTENANDAPQSRAHGKRSRADYEQSSNSKGVATQAAVLKNLSSGFGEIVTSFKIICGIMEKRESTNNQCWIAIQETPGLNNGVQFFALSFLNTKTKQDTFLKMSPDQRLDWITWAQRDA